MAYTHLTREERYQIESLLKSGQCPKSIAKVLNRAPSTIGRELCRNGPGRGYRAAEAHAVARERAKACANAPRVDPASWHSAVKALREGWSPEEIWGRLRLESCRGISHMTIYRRLRADRRSGGGLWRHLRRKGRYRRRGDGRARPRPLGGKSIDQRPAVVELRTTFGHWEGDTMLDRKLRSCLVTLAERKSRYVLVNKVSRRNAVPVRRAINRLLKPFAAIAETLTLDNGKEFSDHGNLAIDTYFAKPYASWQRGTIENTNGLLRQYFPRERALSGVRSDDVQRAADKLNHRPRKCLGYRTPHEVLMEALALRFES
jgi:IS30 family transposase